MPQTRRSVRVRGRRRHNPDRGATSTEYTIMVTLIAVVIIAAVAAFGLAVQGLFSVPAGL